MHFFALKFNEDEQNSLSAETTNVCSICLSVSYLPFIRYVHEPRSLTTVDGVVSICGWSVDTNTQSACTDSQTCSV